jgi:hypothetical protein
LALDSGWLPGSDLPTCYPACSRAVCKRKAHYHIPRAFTRLVRPLGFTAAYPALSFWLPTPRFWLSTPASYPAPTSQLITRRPLEWSANTRPITLYPEHLPGWYTRRGSRQLTRLITRLQPPNLLPGVLSSGLQTQDPTLYPEHLPGWCARWGSRRLTRLQTFGSRLPTGYPAPTSQQPNEMLNHARELTRLTHPAPDSMSRGSLFSGLPISGCQAAAAYSAGGPVGPTLQASTWVGEQVQYAFA